MGQNSKIEWCDHTFNPWVGCQKIGPGCDNCYAESWNARLVVGGAINWGPGAPRRRTSAANWNLPLRWNAQADAFFNMHGRRQRVFCGSTCDIFDNAVPDQWRIDLFNFILSTQKLDWLLLTKRIGNAAKMIGDILPDNIHALPQDNPLSWPWPHVWIGATVCNQEEADRDIPKLLEVPAAKRFLIIEPMLGPIDLSRIDLEKDLYFAPLRGEYTQWCEEAADHPAAEQTFGGYPAIDWVVVGGESGAEARPMHPDWVRIVRDQCADADTPFFFKQWGDWRQAEPGEKYDTSMGRAQRIPTFIVSNTGTVRCFERESMQDSGVVMRRVGKKSAGRLLDGREWNEAPE